VCTDTEPCEVPRRQAFQEGLSELQESLGLSILTPPRFSTPPNHSGSRSETLSHYCSSMHLAWMTVGEADLSTPSPHIRPPISSRPSPANRHPARLPRSPGPSENKSQSAHQGPRASCACVICTLFPALHTPVLSVVGLPTSP
jgi:hypothetical protein